MESYFFLIYIPININFINGIIRHTYKIKEISYTLSKEKIVESSFELLRALLTLLRPAGPVSPLWPKFRF